MAVGLEIPVRIKPSGRTSILERSAQTKKIIALAVSDLSSKNSYMTTGTSQYMVFSQGSESMKARFRVGITKVFDRLETKERAKLARSNAVTFRSSKEGELETVVTYIDLETDTTETADVTKILRSGR
jgi:uncharacterized protein YlxP (DUF503 family)